MWKSEDSEGEPHALLRMKHQAWLSLEQALNEESAWLYLYLVPNPSSSSHSNPLVLVLVWVWFWALELLRLHEMVLLEVLEVVRWVVEFSWWHEEPARWEVMFLLWYQ